MDNQFQIDGEILYIDKERPSKEGSTFMLRDFCLEKAVMGDSNHIKFQLKGTNTVKADGFLPGDHVVVTFALLGNAKVKEDKIGCDTNPTKLDSFSPNANCWKIEFAEGFVRKNKVASVQGAAPDAKADPRIGTINPATNKIWTQAEIDDDLPF